MKEKLLLFLLFFSLLHGDSVFIKFQGNKSITERELYDIAGLHKPYFYEFYKKEPSVNAKSLTLITQTVKNFYRSRGYFHAVVTHSLKEGYAQVVVQENAPVLVSDISTLSPKEISLAIPFKNGAVFDAQKFEESKKDIKLLYADAGYCKATLYAKAWVDIDANLAYLTYQVEQGALCYFTKLSISPSETIDADIIESLLYIEEGEPFSTKSIRQSYESLYAQEGISKALINTDSHGNVTVSITENEKPIRFQAGLGVSSDEGLMALLGIKHRNLFTNLKTLGLSTRVTEIKQTIQTNFDMPLANRNSTGAEVGYSNELFLGFKEEKVFGSIFLKQRNTPYQFQESLVFDHSLTYDSQDEVLFEPGALFILSPKLEWNYDTRDNLLNPTNGHFIRTEAMGSLQSEISDATYYKYKLSVAYIMPFLPSTVALKASLGSLHLFNGGLPPSYLFYAGGMNSNRAYGYRKLGPTNENGDPIGFNSLLETTAEYRFAIYGKLRGVLFSDNTFIGKGEVPNYDKGYYSAGVGLRYITPIGPIAVDFGFDINDPTQRYAFHFHIGELF
ncbi:MAG: hypothetical protein AUK54_02960 [Helicobacteraceae bacterium CG2_30_36_10]|nr:MAG: hypothetical protein AUK54_02960 [Helicobacteraceae bacterium CG2_30_36_10]